MLHYNGNSIGTITITRRTAILIMNVMLSIAITMIKTATAMIMMIVQLMFIAIIAVLTRCRRKMRHLV